jgi:hypothetical protein
MREGWICGQLRDFGKFLRNWCFFGVRQRRGTHVSVPKIGSRGGVLCFGGILGFHADLRRELNRRNLDLVFFGVLIGVPRGSTEEGGQLVFPFVCEGEFMCYSP